MKMLYIAMFLALYSFQLAAQNSDTNWYETNSPNCLIYIEDEGLNKVVWSGSCKNGFAHGTGKMEAFDDEFLAYAYEGQIAEGKFNGKGVFTVIGSGILQGNFVDGDLHGQGSLFTDILEYHGEFEFGEVHGYGHLKFANGEEYIGMFNYGLEHGQGEYFFADSTKYTGTFDSGYPNGFGKIEYANGDTYEGYFYEGVYDGNGKLLKAGEFSYEGIFENGLMHGEGVLVSENGQKMSGEFRNGELFNGKIIDVNSGSIIAVVAEGILQITED